MSLLPLWTSHELETVFGVKIAASWNSYGVSIDSRTIEKGDLFFALSGPNFDGHGYVKSALDAGAAGVVVSKNVEGVSGDKLIIVEDVMEALIALGKAGRNRVNVPIIAVTGSVGKTGTKEALKAALSRHKKTHASILSYNNDVGVPLSLARMPYDTEYGIFEMGMNHSGELAELVKLVRPDVAIVTTVELAHSEFFENVEEIADAKAEIFTSMNNGGTAVLNYDNPHFERLKAKAEAAGVQKIISFGNDDLADVTVLRYFFHDTCSCVIADIMGKVMTYKVGMLGYHWVMNSLAVLAAVDAGVDAVDAAMDAFSGNTSQPCLGSIVEALRGSERDSGLDAEWIRKISFYWEAVRDQYAAFESISQSPASEVYLHEMPGGQFTNLKEQARSLGLESRWHEVARAYHDANQMFGDIVKVTPSSKVVGDMALMMVSQ